MQACSLAIILASVADILLLEGGVKLALYVIDRRKKDRERVRQEGRQEAIVNLLRSASTDGERDFIRRYATAEGIELPVDVER